ncbi:MAG: NYN domain-containing protein [Chthoniobacterales bacterium]|nr:NYN domain-containing protein [Chthoniobacterales bacterium]
MQPDVVILVMGDADFAYIATRPRRCGIRVEVASVAQNLGGVLKASAQATIDLAPLFRTFECWRVVTLLHRHRGEADVRLTKSSRSGMKEAAWQAAM